MEVDTSLLRLGKRDFLPVRYEKDGMSAYGWDYAEVMVKDNRLVVVCDGPVDVYSFDEWLGAEDEE